MLIPRSSINTKFTYHFQKFIIKDFSSFENHYFIIHTRIQYSITILNLKNQMFKLWSKWLLLFYSNFLNLSNLVVCIDLFLSFYIYWGIFSYFWDVYFILSEKFRKHYTCVIAVCSCNIKLNLTFCLLIISFIKIKLNVVESLFFSCTPCQLNIFKRIPWLFMKWWNGPFSDRHLNVFSWSHNQYDILWILNNMTYI